MLSQLPTSSCPKHIARFSTSRRTCDHYKTLGIPRNATRAQIKESFYRLSKELHPDAKPDVDNKEKWLATREAYATLNDDRRRRTYDREITRGSTSSSAHSHPHSHTGFPQHASYHGTYERPKHRATHAWERHNQHTRSHDPAHARAHRPDPLNTRSSFEPGRSYYGRRESSVKERVTTDEDRLRDDNGLWRMGTVFIVTTLVFAVVSVGPAR